MKICESCGKENENAAAVCSACGGSSFKYKCPNCGHGFSEGSKCPICGVKIGQEPQKCPRCGADYYDDICHKCGYVPETVVLSSAGTEESPHPKDRVKKRRTVLWILGWALFFPIPLTIIIARSIYLPKWAKWVLIAALWLSFCVLIEKNTVS